MNFKVLQWNILADVFSKKENCDPKYLLWSYRKKLILEKIESLGADIVCLQEVDHYHDFLEPSLEKLGYSSLWIKRHHDGVALFWKNDRLKLIEHTGKKLSSKYNISNFSHYALYARLQFIEEQKEIIVVVTHLKSGPLYHTVRIAQAAIMMEYLEEFMKNQDIPCIIAGDLNEITSGDVYKFLSTGNVVSYGSDKLLFWEWIKLYMLSKGLKRVLIETLVLVVIFLFFQNFSSFITGSDINYSDIWWVSFPVILYFIASISQYFSKSRVFTHPFQLQSAYSHYKTKGPVNHKPTGNYFLLNPFLPFHESVDGPYTLYIKWKLFHWKLTIDYIWYTKNNLSVSQLLSFPLEKEMDYLPNKDHPSDHLHLMAQFVLH